MDYGLALVLAITDPFIKQTIRDNLNKFWINKRELSNFLEDFHGLCAIEYVDEKDQLIYLRRKLYISFQQLLFSREFSSVKEMMVVLQHINQQLKAIAEYKKK